MPHTALITFIYALYGIFTVKLCLIRHKTTPSKISVMPYAALMAFSYAVFGIFYFFSISFLIVSRFKKSVFSKIELF